MWTDDDRPVSCLDCGGEMKKEHIKIIHPSVFARPFSVRWKCYGCGTLIQPASAGSE